MPERTIKDQMEARRMKQWVFLGTSGPMVWLAVLFLDTKRIYQRSTMSVND